MTARGVRNNNPGNIDFNPRNAWEGQTGIEQGVEKPRFATFVNAEFGTRAMAVLIKNYRGKDGMPGVGKPKIDTVREVISRWAPGNENDTEAYIQSVAKRMGVNPNQSIDLGDAHTLFTLMKPMIRHEQGSDPWPDEVLLAGIARAFK